MSIKHVLIVSERPPPVPDQPATGLSVRHALMAETLVARGLEVTHAWPVSGGDRVEANDRPFGLLALDSAPALSRWLRRNRPCVIILGYWELADWLPEAGPPVVLDHVAPRLLERQFEDRERLAEDVSGLLEALARCDQVWVGNRRQADLMLAWLLLAGHDCRYRVPVHVVPIAGRVVAEPPQPGDPGAPLRLYHGGRDWPWRDSSAWLDVLREASGPWQLDDGGGNNGLVGHAEYIERLRAADLALELCDDNVERRYSQSFRMTDALCSGVPVICNVFLPMADTIRRRGAGWVVESPDALPALLAEIHADRDELARRAANARELAADAFDAERVYGRLGEHIDALSDKVPAVARRRPLLGADADATGTGWTRALRTYAGRWVEHRVRRPMHRWLRRLGRDRPKPTADKSCWIVVSRPDVFPTNHGAAVKIERTAWGLSFHVDEVLLLTDRRGGCWRYRQGRREFVRFPLWLRLFGWPRALNLVRLMARGLAYSNAFLYLPVVDRGLNARLLWLIRRYPVEVVQGEFPAYALPAVWASTLFGTRSVMVEHNIEYRRIAEQVPEMTESVGRMLRRIEIDAANACDLVITVSERDRMTLVENGVHATPVETIPHGVDLQRFAAAEPVDLRARYAIPGDHAVVVYHGIYSYPPNLAAVDELAEVLLPKLRESGHPATVVAIGPEPPTRDRDGVVFTGAVDDLAGHLRGGDLAVIPLRQGGGTRMKILDDFAAGVPVVSTAKGMEGIDVEHGRQLLVVDDADAMARAVIGVLEDDDQRRRLVEAAHQWVSRLDWREIAGRYVERVRAAG